MLAKWDLRSIQVMKYLMVPMDVSKGPHKSETMMSLMLSGRFSIFWNGAQVCFPCRQLMH